MDAVAVNEEGIPYFFKGTFKNTEHDTPLSIFESENLNSVHSCKTFEVLLENRTKEPHIFLNGPLFLVEDHLFKGFHGQAELSNKSFAELDDHHHLGHVDAAFRMHYEDDPNHHDRMFFFLVC